MTTKSYWSATETIPRFPSLQKSMRVDAVVIGGGNTGVSTAYLMKKAGLKVALIERNRIGGVDTSHTSAHLTYVTDLRIRKLIRSWGADHARAVLDAGHAALEQIAINIKQEKIECDFSRVPGFLHTSLTGNKDERKELKSEAELAAELGYSASYVESIPLFKCPGVRFSNQARFHPLKYLSGLASAIPGKGCHVFENSEAEEFAPDAMEIKVNGHTLKCDFIVIATDVPLQGKTGIVGATLFQTKILPYTSYVISARVPRGSVADALFWDTSDPYFFFRLERRPRSDFAIFGGMDHKTGQESDPASCFSRLEEILKKHIPEAVVNRRWSGQVIEAIDGLPYIGETAPRQFVATGFSGNGLTFGTVSALMACDTALGRKNPWSDLFSVNRKKLGKAWNYLRENADYPYYMIKDRLHGSEGKSLKDVKRGEGKILTVDGKREAVYRDPKGKLTRLSPVCTHMGCIVHWNGAESTWDCPCHGSRFKATGEVLAGPAETPLEQKG